MRMMSVIHCSHTNTQNVKPENIQSCGIPVNTSYILYIRKLLSTYMKVATVYICMCVMQ